MPGYLKICFAGGPDSVKMKCLLFFHVIRPHRGLWFEAVNVLKEHQKSLRLSMQTACLLDTLYSSKSDERWELELLLFSVNEEIETQCGGSRGISKTISGFVRSHNSPGLLLLLMGRQVWMPSWGVWIRYDKPREASEACLVGKWHDENGDGGLHSHSWWRTLIPVAA